MRTGLRAKSEKIVMTTSGKKQDRRNLGQARVPSYNILHMEILLRKIKSKLFLPQRKKAQCFFSIFLQNFYILFFKIVFFFFSIGPILFMIRLLVYIYTYTML